MTIGWGQHTIIDLKECNKLNIDSRDNILQWLDEVVDKIHATLYDKPWLEYYGDNDDVMGYTLLAPINASSITGHFISKTGNAHIDIFSCSSYSCEEIIKLCNKYFCPKYMNNFTLHR